MYMVRACKVRRLDVVSLVFDVRPSGRRDRIDDDDDDNGKTFSHHHIISIVRISHKFFLFVFILQSTHRTPLEFRRKMEN